MTRLAAVTLAGDPTWLRSSVGRYYDRLDTLIVPAADDGRGWTGHRIPVDDCVATMRALDTRGVLHLVPGRWRDAQRPMRADTAQRSAGFAALRSSAHDVDWVLQLDTDEVLPDVDRLLAVLEQAAQAGADAVEWPMRVLYRRLRDGRYLQIVGADGLPRYDYPGPVAVRPGVTLVEARRADAVVFRPLVEGDRNSAEVHRPRSASDISEVVLTDADAIVHNSWARPPAQVWRKISSWSHSDGLRSRRYFLTTWLPAPRRWPAMRDVHPMDAGLWPALAPCDVDIGALLHPTDR